MTTPRHNTQIVAQGLARLTSAFITQPGVRAMLAVYLQPFQDLEDATWQVLTMRFLATAPCYPLPQINSVLDVIGSIVGQPRAGLSDTDYKTVIYLRVAVNRATGRSTDWSGFARILARIGAGPFQFFDDFNGAFLFGVWNLSVNPALIAFILAAAVTSGVYGEFAYSTWPDGNDFSFTSDYYAAAGEQGFGSRYQASAGGPMVAAVVISRSTSP